MATKDMRYIYDGQGSGYDNYSSVTGFARVPNRLVKIFEDVTHALHPNMRVMDFGCGTGRLTENLLVVQPHLNITAIEPCDSMARQFRNKFRNQKNCKLLSDGYRGEGYPLPKGTNDHGYDLIISTGVFDYIHITPRVMQDFMDAVKPEGYLAFSYELHSKLWNKPHMTWQSDHYHSHDDSHVRHCIESTGANVLHQSRMLSYIHEPFNALLTPTHSIIRAGLIIAQKPPALQILES